MTGPDTGCGVWSTDGGDEVVWSFNMIDSVAVHRELDVANKPYQVSNNVEVLNPGHYWK